MPKTPEDGEVDILSSVLIDLKQIKLEYESLLSTEVYPRYCSKRQLKMKNSPIPTVTEISMKSHSLTSSTSPSSKMATVKEDTDQSVDQTLFEGNNDKMTVQNRGINGENLYSFYKPWSFKKNSRNISSDKSKLHPPSFMEREGMYRECGCLTRSYMKKENMIALCETA